MKRAVVVAGLVLAACGGSSSRPQHVASSPPTTEAKPEKWTPPTHVAPPLPLRLVDLAIGPTWPLTEPPSLEPHYRVTTPWHIACERRGRLRDDELTYVEVWCRFRREPQFDLGRALLPLRASATPGLADAVRLDIANRITDLRNGQDAVAWLATDVARDPAFFELVIATYVDLGRLDDATVVATEYVKTATPRCGRDVVEAMFSVSNNITELFARVHEHGVASSCGAQLQRATCVFSEAELRSKDPMSTTSTRSPSNVPRDCRGVLDETGLAASRLLAVVLGWRYDPFFVELAQLAISALQIDKAEEVAIYALESSIKLTCTTKQDVLQLLDLIAMSPHVQDRFAARRVALRDLVKERCTR